MMSLVKVMKGAVANDGSIFRRFNNRGNAVPKIDAKIMTTNNAIVTVMGIARLGMPNDSVNRKIMDEHIVALIKAPPKSFSKLPKPLFKLRELEANPLTTIADDWMPTFPPIAVMTGINMAVTGKSAISASYSEIIQADTIPPKRAITNQGRRALV